MDIEIAALSCLLVAIAAIVVMLVSGMFFDEYGWGWIGPGAVNMIMAFNTFGLTEGDTAVIARILHIASIPVGIIGLLVLVLGIVTHLQHRKMSRDDRVDHDTKKVSP